MSTTITHQNQPLTWREGRRQQAWQLHQQGWKQTLIAQALGVSQGAVSQWLKRATEHGVDALRAHPAPGLQPRLSPQQRTQWVDLLSQGAETFGFRGAVWTCRRVARLIKDEFGISYHPAHVSRILAQIGWSPQKPILRASQRDEAAIASWYSKRWPSLKKKRGSKGELSCG